VDKKTYMWLLSGVVLLVSVSVGVRDGYCRFNLPQVEWQTRIEGQDHRALKGYFSHLERGKVNVSPDGRVSAVLLQNLPEVYRKGCDELVNQWGAAALGTAGLGVRILYIEGNKDERGTHALLSYVCFSRVEENSFRDERLASLAMEKDSSQLSMIPQKPNCETCSELVRIVPEKEVRIGGRSVVGLNFVTSSENPCCSSSASTFKEERINFFLFDGMETKPAGSVLKTREEVISTRGSGDVQTVYTAGLVFKKDMKGNIIGILSPYTIKRNSVWSDKGMLRFDWDGGRGEFVRERRILE
jgi:hypothetical protein